MKYELIRQVSQQGPYPVRSLCQALLSRRFASGGGLVGRRGAEHIVVGSGFADDAECALMDYLESDYNRCRPHSALGYLNPIAYEQQVEKYQGEK